MSSTQRVYERHKTDYYVTPKQDVIHFLNIAKKKLNGILKITLKHLWYEKTPIR